MNHKYYAIDRAVSKDDRAPLFPEAMTKPQRKRCLSCRYYVQPVQGRAYRRCKCEDSPHVGRQYPPRMTCEHWEQWSSTKRQYR
jgi:hypothetical protein